MALLGGPARAQGAPRAPTRETRPLLFTMDLGFGAPTGIMGAGAAWNFDRRWALDVGGGIGSTGYQGSVRGRADFGIDDSLTHSLTVSLGPSMGVQAKAFGMRTPHADDESERSLLYTAWLNAGVGWAWRATWGLFSRVELGGAVRLLSTQDDVCRGVDAAATDKPGDEGCKSMHIPHASEVARIPAFPWLSLVAGYAF